VKPQPDPKGSLIFQYGTYTYRFVEPVSATTAPTSSSSNMGLWIGIGAAVLVVIGLVGFLLTRSRRSADDRE
jgi:peptide/nickel transport system substrate-binding protein